MIHRRVLLTFHSSEGQTAKIADYITHLLRESGTEVDLQAVAGAPSPDRYDAVVVGDSIHMSRHSKELTEYLRRHADVLAAKPSALFQVSITSIDTDPEHTAKAQALADALLKETGFCPDIVGLFAGSLAYTKYGWVKRRLVAEVAKKAGLDTDTSRDREYTDWNAVARFANEVQALAVSHAAAPVPAE